MTFFCSIFFFFFLCCLFQSEQWSCIVFCLCCLLVFWTTLGGFLVCILWSCFLVVVLFWFVCFLFHSSQRKVKNGHNKNQNKTTMLKNIPFFELAQLCSQIVFLIIGGELKNANVCWKLQDVLVTVIVFKWAFLNNVRLCVRSSCPSPIFVACWDRNTAKHEAFPSATLYFEGVPLHSFHIQSLRH